MGRQPSEARKSIPGWVYVMTNPSMPGLVKIGRTKLDPERRTDQLSSATGVPTRFVLHAHVRTNDSAATEAAVHRAMASRRVNGRREFFRVDAKTALAVVKDQARTEGMKFRAAPSRWAGLLGGMSMLAYLLATVTFVTEAAFMPWVQIASFVAFATLAPSGWMNRMFAAARRRPVHFQFACWLSMTVAACAKLVVAPHSADGFLAAARGILAV